MLSQGIALEFKKRFGGVEEMRALGLHIGDVGALRRGERFVFALVTKERSSGSYPTMASMRQALMSLRERMRRDGVTIVAAPRLGCGLDRLNWPEVRALIREVFDGSGTTFVVYSL